MNTAALLADPTAIRLLCIRRSLRPITYARKTVRLNAALELIGFALGGEA